MGAVLIPDNSQKIFSKTCKALIFVKKFSPIQPCFFDSKNLVCFHFLQRRLMVLFIGLPSRMLYYNQILCESQLPE